MLVWRRRSSSLWARAPLSEADYAIAQVGQRAHAQLRFTRGRLQSPDHSCSGAIQQAEYMFELGGTARVRIGNLAAGLDTGPVEQQGGLCAGSVGSLRTRVAQVGPVGAQQPIEPVEVRLRQLPPTQTGDVDAVRRHVG